LVWARALWAPGFLPASRFFAFDWFFPPPLQKGASLMRMTNTSQKKKRGPALLFAAALAAAALLPGCLFIMNEPFLEAGSPENLSLPDITGRWRDKRDVYEVSSTKMKNTFTVTVEGGAGPMTATFERLSTTQLLMQLVAENEKKERETYLTVIELTPEKVCYYDFSSADREEIAAKAAANGVTIGNDWLIAKQESREGLLKFFQEAAATPGNACVTLAKESTP
jgi:hypothetical protein